MQFRTKDGDAMKATLAFEPRIKMFEFLRTTLDVGTTILRVHGRGWPSNVDADGLTFRYRRKVPWRTVEKISIQRDYCDGHLARMEIHHHGRVEKLSVGALPDGE